MHNLAEARTQRTIVVRPASTADHPAIRRIVAGAYRQYAHAIPTELFTRYFSDLLDIDHHARHGQLVVAELGGLIAGSSAFYPDTSVQGFGWPPGWAGGRGLAVHPGARGHGVARALLAECEHRAILSGAPMFAFHAAEFMTEAIALYERLGYRRAPEFDVDLAGHYGVTTKPPTMAIAYVRELARAAA